MDSKGNQMIEFSVQFLYRGNSTWTANIWFNLLIEWCNFSKIGTQCWERKYGRKDGKKKSETSKILCGKKDLSSKRFKESPVLDRDYL